jgi:hypothetical protein
MSDSFGSAAAAALDLFEVPAAEGASDSVDGRDGLIGLLAVTAGEGLPDSFGSAAAPAGTPCASKASTAAMIRWLKRFMGVVPLVS